MGRLEPPGIRCKRCGTFFDDDVKFLGHICPMYPPEKLVDIECSCGWKLTAQLKRVYVLCPKCKRTDFKLRMKT